MNKDLFLIVTPSRPDSRKGTFIFPHQTLLRHVPNTLEHVHGVEESIFFSLSHFIQFILLSFFSLPLQSVQFTAFTCLPLPSRLSARFIVMTLKSRKQLSCYIYFKSCELDILVKISLCTCFIYYFVAVLYFVLMSFY